MSMRNPSTGNLMGLAAVAAANLFLLRQGITLLLGQPLYLYLFVSLNMILLQAAVRGKPLNLSHATFLISAAFTTWLCAQPLMLRGVKSMLSWYYETTGYVLIHYSSTRPGFDQKALITLILVGFLLSAIAAAVVGSHGYRRKTRPSS